MEEVKIKKRNNEKQNQGNKILGIPTSTVASPIEKHILNQFLRSPH
jgi:hypothetical protein